MFSDTDEFISFSEHLSQAMLGVLKQRSVTSFIVNVSLVYIEHLLGPMLRGKLHEQICPVRLQFSVVRNS